MPLKFVVPSVGFRMSHLKIVSVVCAVFWAKGNQDPWSQEKFLPPT